MKSAVNQKSKPSAKRSRASVTINDPLAEAIKSIANNELKYEIVEFVGRAHSRKAAHQISESIGLNKKKPKRRRRVQSGRNTANSSKISDVVVKKVKTSVKKTPIKTSAKVSVKKSAKKSVTKN